MQVELKTDQPISWKLIQCFQLTDLQRPVGLLKNWWWANKNTLQIFDVRMEEVIKLLIKFRQ